MRSTTLVALTSLLGLVAAAPIDKRALIIEYYTVTDIVVQTVDETTTVWVTPGAPAAYSTPAPVAAPSPSTVQLPSYPSVTPVSSSAAPAVQPVAPSTSTTSAPSVYTPPVIAPASSPAAPVAPVAPAAAAPVHSSVAAPAAVPASSPAPAPAPVAAPAPSPVAASQPAASSSPANGGVFLNSSPATYATTTLPGATVPNGCTPGSPCTGYVTYYDPSIGVGACGAGPGAQPNGTYAIDGDTVAVSKDMMGTLSSGSEMNPLCFRKLMITNPATNKQALATVVDKCFGCKTGQSLDLTEALLNKLGVATSEGIAGGIEWYWTQ